MAQGNMKITVSVESAIHDGLRDVLQKIWDDHGICVSNISTEWADTSTVSSVDMMLTEVSMHTTTKKPT